MIKPPNPLIEDFIADTLTRVKCALDTVSAAQRDLIEDEDQRLGLDLVLDACRDALTFEAERVHPMQIAAGQQPIRFTFNIAEADADD